MNNKFNLIAEIGCNHKGDIEIAKKHIVEAKSSGIKIVKFQKRDNLALLGKEKYNMPHPVPSNSYGSTYGKHRDFLEFSVEQHRELKEFCECNDVVYSTSVWDINSAQQIVSLEPTFIKVPSACNNNLELINYLLDGYKGDIHISLGMTTKDEVNTLIDLFRKKNYMHRVVLYSCTSGYPVDFKDICLFEIKNITEKYGRELKGIGFSGHHLGIAVDIAAFTLGAKWIERHFTLNRTWKGTDHAASLEPEGLRKLNRDLINVSESMSYKNTEILNIEMPQREKLKWTNPKSV